MSEDFILEKVEDHFEVLHLKEPVFRGIADMSQTPAVIKNLQFEGDMPEKKIIDDLVNEANTYLEAVVMMGD
ncbi:MAG TPA: hypothetical protein VHO46_05675 [Bacteroidales bacterium]|nr:hypothetical protein [Bacteroidales bacterium]